ncbi:unnamed protein product, partial [Didymodactylos carnosus]
LDIGKKSDDLTGKYEKQYTSWLTFESEFNTFRDQIIRDLEQRANSILSNDVNKIFNINKMTAVLNELKILDDDIRHQTSNYNHLHKQLIELRQYSSTDGQRSIHNEQASIETRWNQLNKQVSDKV